MNINNIEEPTIIPENIWEEIFIKQKQLADKYKDIEKMFTLLETTETNLDTAFGQKWIKDFAWRVTEELTEADEAYEMFCKDPDNELLFQHYTEELIDALHFITELFIIAGYNWTDLEFNSKDIIKSSYQIIYPLGLAMNCLKNKPWKQSQMLTDRPKVKKYLVQAYANLVGLLHCSQQSDNDIYNLYFKKNAVNQFRQRSKY